MSKLKENSSYKQLVKEAKKRLLSNNYKEAAKMNRIGIRSKSYLLNSEWLTGDDLYKFYQQVVAVQESGSACGAIGALIDNSVYEKLSPAAKERYVLSISHIYRDMKAEFEKQNKKMNNM